jgi:hypothetical protein
VIRSTIYIGVEIDTFLENPPTAFSSIGGASRSFSAGRSFYRLMPDPGSENLQEGFKQIGIAILGR